MHFLIFPFIFRAKISQLQFSRKLLTATSIPLLMKQGSSALPVKSARSLEKSHFFRLQPPQTLRFAGRLLRHLSQLFDRLFEPRGSHHAIRELPHLPEERRAAARVPVPLILVLLRDLPHL